MKKVMIIFPKDSEAMFNAKSNRTFGGASVQMYLFAKEIKNNQDIEVYSLICDYDKIDFKDAVHFNLIKGFKESDNFILKIWKTHRMISKIKPDVIIQHGLTNESCLMSLYSYFRKIKFVFMFAHDVEVEKRFQSSGKKCYLFTLIMRYSHLLIVQNKYQLKSLIKSFNPYEEKINLIYNGFPVKKHIPKKYKTILWVARSDKWKKPELFIKLASMNPKKKFTMICPNSGNDEYYQNLINLSKSISNLEFIEFVPFDRIDKYFENAYLFVNTSDHEGYPQTFIQSVMNGVPILSLNVDPDNFITNRNCGKVMAGDFELMNKELDILMKNSKLYKKLSENAYNYFLNNHNIHENVKKLINAL